jgi:hypothetical protein
MKARRRRPRICKARVEIRDRPTDGSADEACRRGKEGAPPARSTRGTAVALTGCGGHSMLMFKRSQLYIGLALAGLAEIIVRAFAH